MHPSISGDWRTLPRRHGGRAAQLPVEVNEQEHVNRALDVLLWLNDKVITVSRAGWSLSFPANFQMVAAINPRRYV
jgi:hypothetical protein